MEKQREDWLVFVNSVHDPMDLDQRADRIAEILLEGEPSAEFRRLLAAAIRPGRLSHGFVLKLQNRQNGRPSEIVNAVGREMVRLIDGEGCTIDKAIYQVQQIFGKKGNGRSKCMAALKAYREELENEEWFESVLKRYGP